MLIAATWRPLAAAFLAGAAALAIHSGTDTKLASAKAAFRRQGIAPVDADIAGRDAMWRLGRRLFFDPRLSASGRMSCATCHPPGHAWSGTQARAVGDDGTTLAFKAPTLLEVGGLDRLGWTGRFADTAAITTFAITSPTNMANSLPVLSDRLRDDAELREAFREAFPKAKLDGAEAVAALSVYVNSLESTNAPFDRWVEGDESAIGDGAKRGFALFTGRARCAECHAGASFTDGSFHDIGSTTDDPGRGRIFKTSVKLQHAFKTPSLRGVADRAPYMHDGSKATLEAVVDLYDNGGIDRPSRAAAIGPLHLTSGEKADLVAFLKSLSGETRFRIER